ncbi:hypothetical protein I547_7684 [Mycobacterium kansasii 824]|nr:hypothetical protein I547_7750 [Mycobacterium kansasii 824]ETZ96567.1 hypothetical protein I547_7684 [Mycobacterium kansasii 824]
MAYFSTVATGLVFNRRQHGCPSQLFGMRCPACEGFLTNVQGTARTSGDAFDEPGLVFDLIGNRWYGRPSSTRPNRATAKQSENGIGFICENSRTAHCLANG